MPVITRLGVVAVACTVLGVAPSPAARSALSSFERSGTSSAKAPAQDLFLTAPVRTALVDAAAAHYGLPASDFVGLGSGPYYDAAYYAYDAVTSTYWAGASLVPKAGSYQAGVVVQDDGAYLIFDRTVHGAWQVRDVGYSDTVGDCAAYHVSIPAAVVAVWHWVPGTCHPPMATPGPTSVPKPAALRQPVLGSAAFIPRIGVGWGTYKPSEIFNGGDPSGMISGITWTGWGQPEAYGYGKTSIFKPSGGFYPGNVTAELRAFDLGRCTPKGPIAYRLLEVREPSAPGGKFGKWSVWDDVKTLCSPYA
jgi:hypothetical protein